MTLVVCDVDGTLVDKNKQVTAPTIAAVKRLQEAGIGFTIISARPRSGLAPVADALALDTPMGAFNGGIVFRRDGTVLCHHTVEAVVARGVIELAHDVPVDIWVFADDQWFASSAEGEHVPSERVSSDQEPVIRADFADLLDRADKITFVSDEPAVLDGLYDAAIAQFEGRATIGKSQTYYLDVTATAANKGDGIATLAHAMGVPLDRTIAIGDQANDLAMFARAGRAIAMGNATDAVKAKAADVTLGNDADGVAHAIDKFILGRMM
ncbi:Cof-type HAD-IIB family hydrolase [Sphingomonas radiodurans]|uniref:Cof-type HAD-IIB family hydrolase n=1 Tax=Sphingomonas radiodurans TaxID=2890321 RepID=UPI001E341D5B|nr:Cof-type HAD-IIB family hydrolase [Sphingomonas radiodurans]WBH15955.1 Cof-type HAD-IIB family hydrolase [Sphingomonas radiodurans]